MKKTFLFMTFLIWLGGAAMAQHRAVHQQILKNMSKQFRGNERDEFYRPSFIVVNSEDYSTPTRYCYSYDEDYLLTTLDEQLLTDNNEWMTNYSYFYEYDFNGNVIEALYRDVVNDEDVSLESLTYSGTLLSVDLYQEWDGDDFVNVWKAEYNYDNYSFGVVIALMWEWNGNNWSPMYTYTFTDNGNTSELLMQHMEGGAWQNDLRQTTTFNEDGLAADILTENWNVNTWEKVSLKNYLYTDGLFKTVNESVWEGKGWTEIGKCEYIYDAHGNAVSGESFCGYDDDWYNCDGELEMAYDNNYEIIDFSGASFEATYVELTGVEEASELGNFTFYPNPVKDVLMIRADNFKKAEIYSLTGAKLSETLSKKVDVSGLQAGVYLLKIYDQNGVATARAMVVE